MLKDLKPLPVLYTRNEECCGCTACFAICPCSAINMVEDKEGFDYPQVNSNKCIRCYICLKVCPIKNTMLGTGGVVGADIFQH